MRILTVHPGPHFSVADVYTGWTKAFKALGAQVVEYNLQDRLTFYESAGFLDKDGVFTKFLETPDAIQRAAAGIQTACYRFWPDVLFVVSGFFVPPDLLDVVRERGTKVVLCHTEQPYELGRELERAKHADMSLINDPLYIERFREIHPTFYSPHCYDPEVHFPKVVPPQWASDFAFIGTGYPSRIELLEAVGWEGIDVVLGGMWNSLDEDSLLRAFVVHNFLECLDNSDTVNYYRGTRMSANLYRHEADHETLEQGWAMGPREVELAACGTPFLREPRPEGDEVLWMLPTFDGPADFEEKLRWHLDHPEVCQEIARQARAAVADRTFLASAKGLLKAVERL